MAKKQTNKRTILPASHKWREKQEHQIRKRQTHQKPRAMHLSSLLLALLPDTLCSSPVLTPMKPSEKHISRERCWKPGTESEKVRYTSTATPYPELSSLTAPSLVVAKNFTTNCLTCCFQTIRSLHFFHLQPHINEPPPGLGYLFPEESIIERNPLGWFPLAPFCPHLFPRSALFTPSSCRQPPHPFPPHFPPVLVSSTNSSPCQTCVTALHKCTTMSRNKQRSSPQPSQFSKAGNIWEAESQHAGNWNWEIGSTLLWQHRFLFFYFFKCYLYILFLWRYVFKVILSHLNLWCLLHTDTAAQLLSLSLSLPLFSEQW